MGDAALEVSKGTSLIEIVIATTLIGVVFVVLVSVLTMSTSLSRYTSDKTDMTMIAQHLIEYSTNVETFESLAALADGDERDLSPLMDSYYSDRYDAVRTIEYVEGKDQRLIGITIKVKTKSQPDYSKGIILITQKADI